MGALGVVQHLTTYSAQLAEGPCTLLQLPASCERSSLHIKRARVRSGANTVHEPTACRQAAQFLLLPLGICYGLGM